MENDRPQSGMVELEEVSKAFKTGFMRARVQALDSISFQVGPGSIVGLVGPNGSGKTTIFRIVSGLLKPDRGRVRVMGHEPGAMEVRRKIGYMPEQPGLPGSLTPLEIVEFVGRIFGLTAAQRRSRYAELETLLSLSAFQRQRMRGLSKGQLKRVGLAAAFYNQPALLLLDEPLEGLDPLGAADIKAHLRSLAQQGASILISSHILSDVEALCDHLLIVHEGRILVRGPTEAILSAGQSMEIRFAASSGESLCQEIATLIESRGGRVESAGRARQGLEALFRQIVKGAPPTRPEAGP
ncbi:MAG: ABC transporter ATP-binding protein [Planctomycetota bacterium]